MTNLGVLNGYDESLALALNGHGLVIGYSALNDRNPGDHQLSSYYRAVVWVNRHASDLGGLSGANTCRAKSGESGAVAVHNRGEGGTRPPLQLEGLVLLAPGSSEAEPRWVARADAVCLFRMYLPDGQEAGDYKTAVPGRGYLATSCTRAARSSGGSAR